MLHTLMQPKTVTSLCKCRVEKKEGRGIFMEESKKYALENIGQEHIEKIYPTHITIFNKLNNGVTQISKHTLVDSSQAVKLELEINDTRYDKKQLYNAIKTACQKLLEYYS